VIQKRQQYKYLSHSAATVNSRDTDATVTARTDCDIRLLLQSLFKYD